MREVWISLNASVIFDLSGLLMKETYQAHLLLMFLNLRPKAEYFLCLRFDFLLLLAQGTRKTSTRVLFRLSFLRFIRKFVTHSKNSPIQPLQISGQCFFENFFGLELCIRVLELLMQCLVLLTRFLKLRSYRYNSLFESKRCLE